MALGSTQFLIEMSTRRISWGKCGRCVRLTNLPLLVPLSLSGNLNFLEPSGPVQACNGTALFLLGFELRFEITAFLDVMAVNYGMVKNIPQKNCCFHLQVFQLHGIHSRPVIFTSNLLISDFLITRAALPGRKPDLAVHTLKSLHQSGGTEGSLALYCTNVAGA